MRQYVRVMADIDITGYMQPKSIVWSNGKEFHIETIRDFRPAEILGKAGGDCYTVIICGQEKYLFFEKTNPLFHGRVGRWYVEIPG